MDYSKTFAQFKFKTKNAYDYGVAEACYKVLSNKNTTSLSPTYPLAINDMKLYLWKIHGIDCNNPNLRLQQASIDVEAMFV